MVLICKAYSVFWTWESILSKPGLHVKNAHWTNVVWWKRERRAPQKQSRFASIHIKYQSNTTRVCLMRFGSVLVDFQFPAFYSGQYGDRELIMIHIPIWRHNPYSRIVVWSSSQCLCMHFPNWLYTKTGYALASQFTGR